MKALFPLLALLPLLALETTPAATLKEVAAQGLPEIFTAAKGAVMPNATDQTNNFREGDKCLLLSSKGLADLTGLSTLRVKDAGREMELGAVPRLHLYLNRNEIAALPEEIGRLNNVVYLYCEHNHMHDLPPALAQMQTLEGIYFTANEFTEIPAFVFDMTRLRKLQFSKNKLTVLPPKIGQLTELMHLNLSENQIAVVPDSVEKLTKLRVCDLSDNRIAALPEGFGKVQVYHQLRIRNNPIAHLPEGFATMRGTIDVTGTKIDVAALSPKLRERINTEKPPAVKEVLVGRPEK